jgi:serine/threonine protein kinase
MELLAKSMSKDSIYSSYSTCGPSLFSAKPLAKQFETIKQLYKADIGNTVVKVARRMSDGDSSPEFEPVILKEIDLRMLDKTEYLSQHRSEFAIHKELNHENIIRCFEFEEKDSLIVAVLEFANEPEYLQIELDDNMEAIADEFMLKTFMTELLDALVYIHKRNIVHCDIKLENILGQTNPGQSFPSLKICDFGLARRIDPITQRVYVEKKFGTMNYLAPEVKDKSYISTKVDVWGLGLVFYKMCTTYLPSQLQRDWIAKGAKLPFREADWGDRCDQLRDLITKMLSIDPESRISAQEALEHPYLSLQD